MTGKSVKDVDRYQAVLNSLLALEENKYCADCESKGGSSSPGSCFPLPLPVCDLACRWPCARILPIYPIYTTPGNKCGIAYIFPRPITLCCGARDWATSSQGRRKACSYIVSEHLQK
ncbi:hypothetical protein AMECASPLE_027413 [Ameca splendens]|uniref:Uncharacterized protein n=2 Tax=Goodeidae TaxID=28758 RepID=A0ABU7ED06_9TELE|nr:hypothetical protein [Characodon lateralis]